MTDAERALWGALRNRQLHGFKFRRQATIGRFVADFLCVDAMLVVEVDGGQHEARQDTSRTAFLDRSGYRVVRFWNHEVLVNIEGVLLTIASHLAEQKKTLTQPSPAKAGEG
jgi:very-short-patch-repair endonuclease